MTKCFPVILSHGFSGSHLKGGDQARVVAKCPPAIQSHGFFRLSLRGGYQARAVILSHASVRLSSEVRLIVHVCVNSTSVSVSNGFGYFDLELYTLRSKFHISGNFKLIEIWSPRIAIWSSVYVSSRLCRCPVVGVCVQSSVATVGVCLRSAVFLSGWLCRHSLVDVIAIMSMTNISLSC